MELTVSDGTTTRAVHIYEAYWAPLTEGQVTLRDVILFLFHAGFDGLWHSRGSCRSSASSTSDT